MPSAGFLRALPVIDAELADMVRLNQGATEQLTSTRNQINSLQAHELNLIAAIDARRRKVDRLLDQRLASADAEQIDQLVRP